MIDMPAEKNGNAKNALLEDLESIRNMLDDETSPDADEPRLDEPEETPRVPSQIPLLQDIVETESSDEEIQLEQLRSTVSSFLSDQTLLDPDDIEELANQGDPEIEWSVPDELYQQDELLMFAEDVEDEAADEDEAGSAYSAYQDLDDPEEPHTAAGLAGLTPDETDEFIDLLIEEYMDEILELFRSILRDKLSLLMVHFRDTGAGSRNGAVDDNDDQEDDPPAASDEDPSGML